MGMGIVSDKDFQKEIKDSTVGVAKPTQRPIPVHQIITPSSIISPSRGRKEGDVNVPNSLRNVIGATAHTDGRDEALAVAADFGISPSAAAAYANGATSTASYNKTPNKSVVDEAKQRVSKRARGKLMLALSHLTDEKMGEAKAVELSSIARNMSAIVKDMDPPKEENDGDRNQRPQFIVFAPSVKNENFYETIHVKE